MSNGSNADTLATLRWLIEAGADEALAETAIDRFALASAARLRPSIPVRQGEPARSSPPAMRAPPKPPEAQPAPVGDGDAIGRALETAARCRDLAELKAALEAFDGSQLKRNATNTVFADGNPESRVLFIGEAPGREEDRAGLPFVGPAGKLLDLMLSSIGLDRSSAYIINVLPWRPPENRTPEQTEVALCIPFLRRHIELVQPAVMILLGAVAVRHVLGLAEGIMKYRGRWMEYRVGDTMVPVMPTLHPAYLLRQPAHKKLAWRDLLAIESKLPARRIA